MSRKEQIIFQFEDIMSELSHIEKEEDEEIKILCNKLTEKIAQGKSYYPNN